MNDKMNEKIRKILYRNGLSNDHVVAKQLEMVEKATWPAKYKKLCRTCLLHYGNDTNNCSVMTLALALDISYGKAYATLARHGRKHGRGTTFEVMRAAALELGYGFSRVNMEEFDYKASLAKVRNAGGNRIVIVSGDDGGRTGHVLSIRDGVIYDFSSSRKKARQVFNVFKMNEEAA